MFDTTYFGYYTTSIWEFIIGFLIILTLLVSSKLYQNHKQKLHSEYQYYTIGLAMKILGGLLFFLIYGYYYKGGDTSSYFQSSMSYAELFYQSPLDFFRAYFLEGNQEMRNIFSITGKPPLEYVTNDPKTNFVVKFFVPFAIVAYNSYLISTILISVISFLMVWQLFKSLSALTKVGKIAFVACFCIPSTLMWAAGVSKDIFTFSSTCWLISELILYFVLQNNKQKNSLKSALVILINAIIIIKVKPYIIIALFPSFILWRMMSVVNKHIERKILKIMVYPLILSIGVVITYGFLSLLGESLDKFQIDQVLDQAVVIQQDLKQEYYGGQTFDIGDFDASLTGVISKAPIAIFSGLFYPLPYQVSSIVSLLSAVENSVILLIFIRLIITLRIRALYLHLIKKSNVYVFLISFVLLFAFMIGLTTPNFGALVRFKTPLLPFFVIILSMLNLSRKSYFITEEKAER